MESFVNELNNYPTSKLLDEYVKICNKMEKIKKIIENYKKELEDKLMNNNDENEQKINIDQFKEMINKIKEDTEITTKYKLLKQKQTIIKDLIDKRETKPIASNNNEIDNVLNNLRNKYKNKIIQ
jgi:hypothetical protein